MEKGYIEGKSDNLPVDSFIISVFFMDNMSAEIEGVKNVK